MKKEDMPEKKYPKNFEESSTESREGIETPVRTEDLEAKSDEIKSFIPQAMVYAGPEAMKSRGIREMAVVYAGPAFFSQVGMGIKKEDPKSQIRHRIFCPECGKAMEPDDEVCQDCGYVKKTDDMPKEDKE